MEFVYGRMNEGCFKEVYRNRTLYIKSMDSWLSGDQSADCRNTTREGNQGAQQWCSESEKIRNQRQPSYTGKCRPWTCVVAKMQNYGDE